MSDSIANSTVAQLLLRPKGREGTVEGVIQTVGTSYRPESLKRKRDNSKCSIIESDKESQSGESSSGTEDETTRENESPEVQACTTSGTATRCPMCSFVAETDAALRLHYLYHGRLLSGIGQYQRPNWFPGRRRTVSDSPLMIASPYYSQEEKPEKESSLKDLLLGPRKPAVMASSYLRSIVATMSTKTMKEQQQHPDMKPENSKELEHKTMQSLPESCISECLDNNRPGSAPSWEQIQSYSYKKVVVNESNSVIRSNDIGLTTNVKSEPSDCVDTSSSSTPISVGHETFSPSTNRWHGNQTATNQNHSCETPVTKKRKSTESDNSDIIICDHGQPVDLSSKPKVLGVSVDLDIPPKFVDTASQCELMKSEPDQIRVNLSTTEPEVTSSSLAYRCPFCSITFDDDVLYSIHMGCHSHSDPFMCNVCGKRTVNKYAFYTHIMRGHYFSY